MAPAAWQPRHLPPSIRPRCDWRQRPSAQAQPRPFAFCISRARCDSFELQAADQADVQEPGCTAGEPGNCLMIGLLSEPCVNPHPEQWLVEATP